MNRDRPILWPGLGLGAAFLAIAMLRTNPRVGPWLELALALVTVTVFARSLMLFLGRYA